MTDPTIPWELPPEEASGQDVAIEAGATAPIPDEDGGGTEPSAQNPPPSDGEE